jgi:DNA-binding MarR family transcriptional regulator
MDGQPPRRYRCGLMTHHNGAYNVMRALEAFADGSPLSVPELAERLGLGPRTARQIVYQLVQDRYLEQLPGRYRRRWIISNRGRQLGTRLALAWTPDWQLPSAWIPKLHDTS